MRIRAEAIYAKKKKREKIAVLTAYDFVTAGILDGAGVDIVLVGDSLGMVLLGHESTVPVTLRDMLHHARAVTRGIERALVVADMPYGSYDTPEHALRNARRLLKEARVDAVKLEGGQEIRPQLEALRQAGIEVMGHVGMMPQSVEKIGGYKVQGRTRKGADAILRDARLLDKLGAFAIVIECVPGSLAARITKAVKCPTIGIGAGVRTDGQVLVLHDMLGFEGKVRPRFVRRYANLGAGIKKAVSRYCDEVRTGKFPSKEESY